MVFNLTLNPLVIMKLSLSTLPLLQRFLSKAIAALSVSGIIAIFSLR